MQWRGDPEPDQDAKGEGHVELHRISTAEGGGKAGR
ncbi:MAG: hypothetical protein ACJAZ8_002382 [Planctomycetota bacterium]|jgi:hypothetical protein